MTSAPSSPTTAASTARAALGPGFQVAASPYLTALAMGGAGTCRSGQHRR